MIISQISLSPFAGIPDLQLDFDKGLNVLLGRNEAGKSTVFHALHNVLFTSAKLTPARHQRIMGRFLPVGGGDTASVELGFRHEGEDYALGRTWGPAASARLRLPNGSTVSDERAISEHLAEFLHVPEGTYRSVLMTRQSGLGETLRNLRDKDGETLVALGDVLKSAILESDGISIERFRGIVDDKIGDYFSRWDISRNRPVGDRGVENPWKKELGIVLRSYYEKESARVAFENAVALEENVDRLNREIAKLQGHIEEIDKFIKENRQVVEGGNERRALELELVNTRRDIREHKEANQDWPVLESTIRELEAEKHTLEGTITALECLKSQPEEASEYQTQIDEFPGIAAAKRDVEDSKRNIEGAQTVDEGDIDKLTDAQSGIRLLEAELRAGQVSVRIRARGDMDISVRSDLGEVKQVTMEDGETSSFSANTDLALEHPDWSMEIRGGKSDSAALTQKIGEKKAEFEGLLSRNHVASLDQAQKVLAVYKELQGKLQEAEQKLRESVSGELLRLGTRLTSVTSDLQGQQQKVDGYINTYSDKDRLLLALTELLQKEGKIQQRIDELPPPPKDVEDMESLITEFSEREAEASELHERSHELEIGRAAIAEPQQSSEELRVQVSDCSDRFETALRKGKAVLRVKEVVDDILASMDEKAPKQLERAIEEQVYEMSGGRYGEVRTDNGLPTDFVRADGETVGVDLLSTGTLDILGLALRLSMADLFLDDAEAFLVMDDPLTDLDGDRRDSAAKLLREYGLRRQLIVLTCHRSHADLLGGHRLNLD